MCFYVIQGVVVDEDDACFVRDQHCKEKSVFLCYTRQSWSMKMMPALSGINTK